MADAPGEKKEGGWLSKIFWGAVKVVTIGLVAAVAWQMFLDPMFFPLFHDTSNLVAQAWVTKINSWFSWIPQTVGLSKTPGLLTPLMKSFLSTEINAQTPPAAEKVIDVLPGGDSLDDLTGVTAPAAEAIQQTSWLGNFNPLDAMAPAFGFG